MLVNLSKRRDYRSNIQKHRKNLRKEWGFSKKEIKRIGFDYFFTPTNYVGVYESTCDEHSINNWCKQHATYCGIYKQHPTREEIHNAWDYGVADNIEQILEYYNNNPMFNGNHVIFIHTIRKNYNGGWRWHKWGQYIGTQNPKCEYLDDEPEISEVLIYSIYQVI